MGIEKRDIWIQVKMKRCSTGEHTRQNDIFTAIENRKRFIKRRGVDRRAVERELSGENIDGTATAGIKVIAKYPARDVERTAILDIEKVSNGPS